MNIEYDGFELPMVSDSWAKKHCLFVGVSGAHSFGWKTPKSDLDLRFIFFPDIGQMVSPFFKCHTKQRLENQIDITEYPVDHFLQLLEKGNGNALDNLFEPKIVEQKERVRELQQILKSHIHKGFVGHCLGYSIHLKKDFDIPNRLEKYGLEKLLLCRYRELLQGMFLLDDQIEYNLPRLLKQYKTIHAETILFSYVSGVSVDKTILKEAITETDIIHKQLGEAMDDSDMPTHHDSGLKIFLDRWIREYYLGTQKQESFVCEKNTKGEP